MSSGPAAGDGLATVPSGQVFQAPTAAQEPAFRPGAVLAERYTVVRLIARGGMGEVYEVEDRELGERVALKTILPHGLQEPLATERFRREIQLARKVTHPNVCRIFELGYHQSEDHSRVLFLTMELLCGETLTDYLRRQGRLTPAEALPLVRQMAEALGAAHEVGVIHRDFKSLNVMLVPVGKTTASGAYRRLSAELPGMHAADSTGWRAVVTDFGLARLSNEIPDSPPSLTGSQIVLGTPATVAPEQVLGEPVGPQTDVYALGIVLYEMLTGALPFQGSAHGVLYQRLVQDAPSPRLLVPDLDPRWEATVLRCLQRQPKARFHSTIELLHALEDETIAPASLVQMRRSIGVLGFKNLSRRPDSAWLSTAFSEMLCTELATGEKLRLATGEAVAQTKLELNLLEEDSYSDVTLRKIRQSLGVDAVAFGSYLALGGMIRLDLRLQDTGSGEVLTRIHEKAPESDLFDLITRAGTQLRQKLGVEAATVVQPSPVRTALPGEPEAARLYAEGLEKLRAFDYPGARSLLEGAIRLDPGFALAHAALADVWQALGHDGKELEETRLAFELCQPLSREERLGIEARHRAASRDWVKGIELYRALFTFYPDNVEHGLHLAMAQGAAHQRTEALDTLHSLQRLSLQPSERLRVELCEYELEKLHRDAVWLEKKARRVAEKATALGSRFLVAAARGQQGLALRRLGEVDQAVAAFEAARQIYTELGNIVSAGDMLHQLGTLLSQQGEMARAQEHFEDYLELCRKTGHRPGETLALRALCSTLRIQGDLNGSWQYCLEAQKIAEELGDADALLQCRTQQAMLLFERGELFRARSLCEKLLTELEGQIHPRIRALGRLGSMLRHEGRLAEAQTLFEESAALAEQLGEAAIAALVSSEQAEMFLDDGHPEEARPMILKALEVARKAKSSYEQVNAYDQLARCELAAGRLTEAQAAVDAASGLLRQAGRQYTPVAITAAAMLAASGQQTQIQAAIESLQTLLEETTGKGAVFSSLQIRLALGELELKAGATTVGREQLEALEMEAVDRGFLQIAQQADALLQTVKVPDED